MWGQIWVALLRYIGIIKTSMVGPIYIVCYLYHLYSQALVCFVLCLSGGHHWLGGQYVAPTPEGETERLHQCHHRYAVPQSAEVRLGKKMDKELVLIEIWQLFPMLSFWRLFLSPHPLSATSSTGIVWWVCRAATQTSTLTLGARLSGTTYCEEERSVQIANTQPTCSYAYMVLSNRRTTLSILYRCISVWWDVIF